MPGLVWRKPVVNFLIIVRYFNLASNSVTTLVVVIKRTVLDTLTCESLVSITVCKSKHFFKNVNNK